MSVKDEVDEQIANILVARLAIVDNICDSGEKSGEFCCPVCSNGNLRYVQHLNSHIWAKCSTKDCVEWVG